MSGLGSRDGSGNRLIVAHLADEDDVGVLTQGAAQRRSKAAHIGANLALVDQRAAALIDVLDGVLNRDDVVAARLIDVVDHGGQRGGFAAARGAGDQDQPRGSSASFVRTGGMASSSKVGMESFSRRSVAAALPCW